MSQAPVHIVRYDPSWPEQFHVERALLKKLVEAWVVGSIEHVGSTAVVGLSAKPVIDVMVGVESLQSSVPARNVLIRNGYQYADYKTDEMHWLCKPSFAFRTHHVHLIPYNGHLWRERIAFRDLLRSDPVVAIQYELLKLELAKKFEFDREAYTDGKYPFITGVLGVR